MAVIEAPSPGLLSRWFAAAMHLRARIGRTVTDMLPKGLYARALLIIIAPIVLLESVVAFTFMERHWNQVTRRLSEAAARDVGALVEIYESVRMEDGHSRLIDIAQNKMGLTSLQIMPPGELPASRPKPFFGLLDRALTEELAVHVQRPFWIDTLGRSGHVEIRVKADGAVLRFIAPRNQIYASNSHIFLVWMVGTSIVLLTAAILLLRNQIRPILRLADAAKAFGKGRGFPPDFTPRGAREVRDATQAFIEMGERITQHVDQRTTMLAGVSHDLRTILTRFKLELEMLGRSGQTEAMKADVAEMQHMLEDYLAFARGDGGETATPTNVRDLIEDAVEATQFYEADVRVEHSRRGGNFSIPLKRQAIKRAIVNLVSNAARFGKTVLVRSAVDHDWLRIEVEDDGPGIPASERQNVFRPFYRIEKARTPEQGHTGLGLAIALDIAKSHGGDIVLDKSPMGGLKATIRIPL
ncbi:MAG: HAMP domain-containing protein [Hyphomicrobiales bacterium]|nr:HAMP domain-containing protein [Hyphomicrobiales bacterium]